MKRSRVAGLAIGCFVLILSTVPVHAATPHDVADALERPSVSVRAPERAMLLGADQAGGRVVAIGERGIVLLSDDQGAHWRQVQTPTSVTLTAVRFADKDHGFAVGHGGVVLRTDDGGETWQTALDGNRIAKVQVAAALAAADPVALKSAERIASDGPDKPLLDLLVMDAQRVLVVGAYGLSLLTQDGGVTWISWRDRLENPKELHLYSVRQRGNRLLIAGEQGLVLQSDDGGNSFKKLTTPYAGSFFTAELPDDKGIVVAGLRGNLWRSGDAGATWSQVPSPITASITASSYSADGGLLFANQAGMVLALRGDQLQPAVATTLPQLNYLLQLDSTRLLALSVQGIQRVDLQATDPVSRPPSR